MEMVRLTNIIVQILLESTNCLHTRNCREVREHLLESVRLLLCNCLFDIAFVVRP